MKSQPITIRLSPDAMKKCKEAQAKGYTMSAFIEESILGNQVQNKSFQREMTLHLCQIETITTSLKSGAIKENIRAELNEVWQILKLSQEPT